MTKKAQKRYRRPLVRILTGVMALLVVGACYLYHATDTFLPFFDNNQTMTVQTGDTIVVDYIGRLTDGTIFDTSIESVAQEAGIYNPQRNYEEGLSFTVGAGQMIAGFDAGVVGMALNETKTVEIPADQAYGQPNSEMLITVPRAEVGDL